MMVVTIAVWPNGNPARIRSIETLYVCNISDLSDVSDYEYQFNSNPRDERFPAGEILGHERSAGAWELVRRILVQEYGTE